MKIFYKEFGEEINRDEYYTIKSDKWLRQPKRGIMFHANDARALRRETMNESTAVIVMDKAIKAVTFTLIAIILIAGVWFLVSQPSTPVVEEYTIQGGRTFVCVLYENGDVDCVDQDDPDVGGGRIQ